jgi:signal transduction histidine kinase
MAPVETPKVSQRENQPCCVAFWTGDSFPSKIRLLHLVKGDVYMLRVVAAVAISVCAVFACAETRFTLNESNDKLSNALTRKLIVTAEDGRSTLELRQTEDSPVLTVFIDPASTIFPDDVDVPGSAMSVGVTMRSSAMDEPVSVKCDMNWMKYDFCYMKVTPKSARKLFTGDFIAMQLARTADRLTFPIGGAEYEQALSKVLEPAEEVARAKAAAEEMRKEETTRKQAAEQEAAAATERERAAREIAQKPAADGRTAVSAHHRHMGRGAAGGDSGLFSPCGPCAAAPA